jgi:hypothetical protein
MPMLFSPTIGAAVTAGYWFLWVRCPACRTTNAIDLRTLDRHRNAAVSSLIPALSCRSCRPNAPFAELVRLSRTSVADEMRFPRSISMPFHLAIEVAVVGAMPEMIRRFSMLVFLDFWIPGNDDPINGGRVWLNWMALPIDCADNLLVFAILQPPWNTPKAAFIVRVRVYRNLHRRDAICKGQIELVRTPDKDENNNCSHND